MEQNTDTQFEHERDKLQQSIPWNSPTYARPLSGKKKDRGTRLSTSEAVITRLSEIQTEQINWLWPSRIARGKLTLIAGDPGLGKSLLTVAIAATISKGGAWPDDNTAAPIGDVILLSAEDDPADTIRPRLDAAMGDCTRVHILQAVKDESKDGSQVQRMFSLKNDLAVLEQQLSVMSECQLLIVDPVSAYLGDTDSHNNADVRGVFAPLADLAARHKIAIIAVSHLNKGIGNNALYRTTGSLAFVAAARAAHLVTKDNDNPQRRLFLPIKNNLAKDSAGLAYSITEAENGAPLIVWETEPVVMTADEALVVPEEAIHTDTGWAAEFLRDLLADGSLPAAEVKKQAREAGINEKPLRSARERLGIKPKKSAFSGGWEWSLPNHEDALKSEDALPKTEGTLDTHGHLGNGP